MLLFFLGGFESDNPRVFPGICIFCSCGGGGTYLLKKMASSSRMARKRFVVLSFNMVCSYISALRYTTIVLLVSIFF